MRNDALVGKRIVGIDVSENEDALRFRVVAGAPIVWYVQGDCCSHSYWHDGYSLNALRDATVSNVATLDLPDAEGSTYDCLTQVYGYAITTDKGAATLAFRNDSNGYYGGWCDDREDGPQFRWREITANDWQQGGANDPPVYTPEELAAQKFRAGVRKGLGDCRESLVKQGVPVSWGAVTDTLVDAVVGLQETPTLSILMLGVYLATMADAELGRQAKEQA